MDSLKNLLESWRVDKDIEKLIGADFTLDPQKIQAFLDASAPIDRKRISEELSLIAQELDNFIAQVEQMKNDIQSQLDKNVNNTKACLSYTSAETLGQPQKQDE